MVCPPRKACTGAFLTVGLAIIVRKVTRNASNVFGAPGKLWWDLCKGRAVDRNSRLGRDKPPLSVSSNCTLIALYAHHPTQQQDFCLVGVDEIQDQAFLVPDILRDVDPAGRRNVVLSKGSLLNITLRDPFREEAL